MSIIYTGLWRPWKWVPWAIDDSKSWKDSTWSSDKINDELNSKIDEPNSYTDWHLLEIDSNWDAKDAGKWVNDLADKVHTHIASDIHIDNSHLWNNLPANLSNFQEAVDAIDNMNLKGNKWDMEKIVYDPNNIAKDVFNRANHTGQIELGDVKNLWAQLDEAKKVGTKSVDESAISEWKVLAYNASKGELEYQTRLQDILAEDSTIVIDKSNPWRPTIKSNVGAGGASVEMEATAGQTVFWESEGIAFDLPPSKSDFLVFIDNVLADLSLYGRTGTRELTFSPWLSEYSKVRVLVPWAIFVKTSWDIVTESYFPIKWTNGFENSPLRWDKNNNRIISTASLEVPAGTLYVSENLALSGANLGFYVRDVAKNRQGFLVGYTFDDNGSSVPYYRRLRALKDWGQQLKEETTSKTSYTQFIIPADDNYLVRQMTFKSATTGDAKVTIRVNSHTWPEVSKFNVSWTAWQEVVVNLIPPFFAEKDTSYYVTVDGGELYGTTVNGAFVPYYKSKVMFWEKLDLVDESQLQALDDVYYSEPNSPISIPTNIKHIILKYPNSLSGNVIQTLPNIGSIKQWTTLYAENYNDWNPHSIFLSGYSWQNVGWVPSYQLQPDNSVNLIADKRTNSWIITDRQFPRIAKIIDGDDNIFDINHKIKFDNAIVTPPKNEWDPLTITIKWEDGLTEWVSLDDKMKPTQYGGNVNKVNVEEPLEVFLDPSSTVADAVRLRIKNGVFEPIQPSGYYASAIYDEVVEGTAASGKPALSFVEAPLWFDDPIVLPNDGYLYLDKQEKAIIVQEEDELDPNVTGGTAHIALLKLALKGKASWDGIVSAYLYDKQAGEIVKDVWGVPISVTKAYKDWQALWDLIVGSIFKAKGQKKIQVIVKHNFDTEVVVWNRTNGNSSIVIQEITKDKKTGDALQQYSLDTWHTPIINSKYIWVDFVSFWEYIKELNSKYSSATTIGAWTTAIWPEGWFVNPITPISVQADQSHFSISSDGSNLGYFLMWNVLNSEKTNLIRRNGWNIDAKITLTDKKNAFNLIAAKWMWEKDAFSPDVFSWAPIDDNEQWVASWEEVGRTFISEDIVSWDHTATVSFKVPDDANNIAVFLVPTEEQNPITLKLKNFELSANPAFTWWEMFDSLLGGKEPFISTELTPKPFVNEHYKRWVQKVPAWDASYRFTINKADTPMPIGKNTDGDALFTAVDEPWYKYESMRYLVAWASGRARISASFKTRVGEKVAEWGSSVVNYWVALDDGSGTYTPIPQSKVTHTLAKSLPWYVTIDIPEFDTDIVKGQKFKIFASSNIDDGAYIQADGAGKILSSLLFKFDAADPLVDNPLYGVSCLSAISTTDVVVTKTATTLSPNVREEVHWISLSNDGVVEITRTWCYSIKLNVHVRVGQKRTINLWLEKQRADGGWAAVPNSGQMREIAQSAEGYVIYSRNKLLSKGEKYRWRVNQNTNTDVTLKSETLPNWVTVPSFVLWIKL